MLDSTCRRVTDFLCDRRTCFLLPAISKVLLFCRKRRAAPPAISLSSPEASDDKTLLGLTSDGNDLTYRWETDCGPPRETLRSTLWSPSASWVPSCPRTSAQSPAHDAFPVLPAQVPAGGDDAALLQRRHRIHLDLLQPQPPATTVSSRQLLASYMTLLTPPHETHISVSLLIFIHTLFITPSL